VLTISCSDTVGVAGLRSSEIMLDFDNCTRSRLLRLIRSRWRFLFRFSWPLVGRLRVQSTDIKRTRHGYHVRIRVKNKIPSWELNFLQLALGSDYRRECMNLRRIISCKQMRSWNVLYAFKFNNRGDITSRERPDARLSRRTTDIVKGFQKGLTFP
jgi:hypothetical protein